MLANKSINKGPNMGDCILGSMLGSPYFGKLRYRPPNYYDSKRHGDLPPNLGKPSFLTPAWLRRKMVLAGVNQEAGNKAQVE